MKKSMPEPEENFTFLGRGVDFKGVIRFDGTVRIETTGNWMVKCTQKEP